MNHTSVLMNEVLHWLDLPKRRSIIDATLGLGGHCKAIFDEKDFHGTMIGIDQDQHHLDHARRSLQKYSDRFTAVKMNFADLGSFLDHHGIDFDGVLFDLGVASPHYDIPERGFSFQHTGPLDMRMDQDSTLTAEVILNSASENELTKIFRDYGEESLAKRISLQICRQRQVQALRRTDELAALVKSVYQQAGYRSSQKHPATKVFQALRIAVNRELEVLETALKTVIERIKPDGRILVISYHSLEDRLVKRAFQRAEKPCTCPPQLPICACGKSPQLRILTRKALTPTEKEIRENPRARSAKIRVAEKL